MGLHLMNISPTTDSSYKTRTMSYDPKHTMYSSQAGKSGGGSSLRGNSPHIGKSSAQPPLDSLIQEISETPSNEIFHALPKYVQVANDILRNGQFSRFELIKD
jgi:hypothetical protein